MESRKKIKMLPNEQIYWLCQVGGWFFYWLVLSLINVLTFSSQGEYELLWKEQVQLTIFAFLGLVVTHLYRLYVKRKQWTRLSVGRLIRRLIASVFFLSLFLLVPFIGIIAALGLISLEELTNNLVMLRFFLSLAIIMSLWIAIYFSVQYFKNYRKAQVEQLLHESFLKEASLNKLRSQLNPHFIFNSLNSIRALVSVDPAKARDAITALSHIFRKTLQLDKVSTVSIEEELQIVEDYLKLEKIRFEERLEVSIKVDEDVYPSKVPPLMLQTLVENGIKHGISNLPQGGKVSLHASLEDEKLKVEICNSGQLKENNESKGYGLKNTRERLKLLYEGEGSLELFNLDKENVMTCVRIPREKPIK